MGRSRSEGWLFYEMISTGAKKTSAAAQVLPDTALLFDYWMDSTCTTFRGCDIGCSVQLAYKQSPTLGADLGASAWRHLGAGMLAGAVSRTVRSPRSLTHHISPTRSPSIHTYPPAVELTA